MAAAGGRFESARSIEERKEQTRIARAEVLRQAKANFEKEERRKELKRLRGEDTWMLPDVNERIEHFSQEHSVKKKKKKDKHSKKVKKEKKKKSKEQKYEKNNESSDSSSSSEEEWVEAVPPETSGKEKAWKLKGEKSEKEDNQGIQRDEWMTVDFMSVKTVSSSSLKAEKETKKKIEQAKTQALEQSRLLERELNPYWKDGGTGLPPEDSATSSVTKVSVIEDGGLSWLRKSYQRMKEQAEKQNRNFEDIVAERYGSMEIFQSKLEEAEKTASAKEDCRRERWRKPTYSDKALSSEESRKSHLTKYNKSSRDRHSSADITKDKDKFCGDEKNNRTGTSETYRRDSSSRQSQEFSALGNLRPKFIRPSDDELPFHHMGRNVESSSSPSALATQGSVRCGFRKPTESEESLSSWSRSDERGGEKKHSHRNPLETSHSVDYQCISEDVSQKSHDESSRDDSLRKEHLQNTKSSFSGSHFEDESVHILSVDEKNKLGAKIIKAEMMGNMELAEQLKAQLEKANKFKETISSKKSGIENEDQQEVILVRTDQSGRVWPVNTPERPLDSKGGRRKRQMASTHEEKERVRYFHDDDNLSLNDLVKNEKMGTAENQNRLFMRMASKFMGKTDGDYYTLDDMFVSKAAEKEHFGEEAENQRKRAIAEHRSLAAQMERCLYCFDSSQFPKHLIIAIGVKMFRKSLVKMFEGKGLDCVFLETNMSLKKQYHMVYECIPVPKEVGDMAPIYFKKAIMESDEEWSMNKKLIDLSSKDIRKSVPKGLPYFSVDFGLQGGFAHVIEDQHKFPHYFGKEIIGGMLDVEPRLWRRGVRESFEDQRKKALQFAQWWKPFDFTKNKKC
ncbi:CWF19-like protein 2 isoform X2 [Pipistrellus kuhlii]|uniref:CWF19-like protein 2 isoform X2 n=1 Tax=Pipistrellus kuhlii TaxID=59472 RepID=UPI00174F1322|nr:CWF19-like protein 2 isoform X2 [Pipistrellus kuhlii]